MKYVSIQKHFIVVNLTFTTEFHNMMYIIDFDFYRLMANVLQRLM